MEDYPYDASLEWVPREYPVEHPAPPQAVPQWQQPQYYQRSGSLQAQQLRQPGRPGASTTTASTKGRMSKSEALDLLESLKKSILIAALITFGVISGLVATHVVGSAANNTSSPSPSANPAFPQQNSSDNGGFFNQQGGGGGGYQFGSGGSQPFSGSHTS
jgi:hypothetical protein